MVSIPTTMHSNLPCLEVLHLYKCSQEVATRLVKFHRTTIQFLVIKNSSMFTGGQAYMMKLRKTSDRSPSSMIVEPPHDLNGTDVDPSLPFRWRHMKYVLPAAA
jgi:hypothetical protein